MNDENVILLLIKGVFMTKEEYLKLKQECYDIIHDYFEDENSTSFLPFDRIRLVLKCQFATNRHDYDSKRCINEIIITLTDSLQKEGYLEEFLDLRNEVNPNVWYTLTDRCTHDFFEKNIVLAKKNPKSQTSKNNQTFEK